MKWLHKFEYKLLCIMTERRPQSDVYNNASEDTTVLITTVFATRTSLAGGLMEEGSVDSEDENTRNIVLISQSFQCALIIIIITLTVISNSIVIFNISQSDIKSSIVSFILIQHLCIVDLLGAFCILPLPLLATVKGELFFSPKNQKITTTK